MRKRFLVRAFVFSAAVFATLLSVRLFTKSFPALVPPAVRRLVAYRPFTARPPRSGAFETALRATLERLEVRHEDITEELFVEDSLREIRVRVPQGRPIEWIVWDISRAAAGTSYHIDDCEYAKRSHTCVLRFRSGNDVRPEVRLVVEFADRFFANTAKLAILIEDFEFQPNQTTIDILSFSEPLSVSLQPASDKAAWTAQAADQYGKEVVIQLGLEPTVRVPAQPSLPMIMVHYPADKIRGIIADAAKSIPNFSGFNNVYGSRALEDSKVMEVVLREIQKRHGYFVETKASRSSVVPSLADRIGLPYAMVTAHIPDDALSGDIEDNLRHLCVVAQRRGTVVVSVKASADLVQALDAMQDVFRQNGVRLAYISEIVEQPKT